MEFIEISAKNVDDAITQATVQLGITSDQLEYEVLDKGSTGFLGIGSKNAVIKARKKRYVPILLTIIIRQNTYEMMVSRIGT